MNNSQGRDSGQRIAHTVRLSAVEPEDIEWLWPGRIPFGKLTILDGDPGLGKSSLLYDIAARLSRGHAMPDGSFPDYHAGDLGTGTVILSAEDGLADTIRPRLDAAGANCDRITALTEVETDRLRVPTVLDTDAITAAICEVTAIMVVVDPLMAYLGQDVNSHRDQDVRTALAPLARLAEKTGAAVVVVRHLNKTSGGNPLYRGGGSIGIIGAARSGLLVAPDPDDESRRVLAVTKANLAEKAPSLSYRLATDEKRRLRVLWEGESDKTAQQLLAAPADDEQRSALDEAKDFLRTELGEGARGSKEVHRAAREAGISEKTLQRARQSLGVVAQRVGFGAEGRWIWSLNGIGGQEAWPSKEAKQLTIYENNQSTSGVSGSEAGKDAQGSGMTTYGGRAPRDEGGE